MFRWLKEKYENARELEDLRRRAGLSKPSATQLILVATFVVSPYFLAGILIAEFSFIGRLITGETWPTAIGGWLIAILVFIMHIDVNVDGGALSFAEEYYRRIGRMNLRYVLAEATAEFNDNNKRRSSPYKILVLVADMFLIMLAIWVGIIGETPWHSL